MVWSTWFDVRILSLRAMGEGHLVGPERGFKQRDRDCSSDSSFKTQLEDDKKVRRGNTSRGASGRRRCEIGFRDS